MKVLALDQGGFMLDFVLRAQNAGHDVRWYVPPNPKNDAIGKGIVDRVPDWREWVRWADLIMLADNTRYLHALEPWRKQERLPIVGATLETADWELKRSIGQAIFKKCGIPVPPYKEFRDYDSAIAHVKKTGERFVSKPCYDETDKSLSYVAKTPADLVYMLERWKKAKKLGGPFMLQQFIGGTEMAVGGWFGPHGFNEGVCENWEFKKLMAGDTGPATGETGTVMRVVKKSKLADKVLFPLEKELRRTGYCGYVDVNCIIDDAGNPWPLEFTTRPGWPTFNIQQSLVKGDPVSWLVDLANGKDAKPFETSQIACGVVMAIPDFPYSHLTRKEVTGVPVYGVELTKLDGVHLCECMMGKAPQDVGGKVMELPCVLTAGDYVLVASGTGESVKQASARAYRLLDRIKVPNSPFWRPDIGARLKKQLPGLQANGYAVGMTYA